MQLHVTPAILQLLNQAPRLGLSQEMQEHVDDAISSNVITWKFLQEVSTLARQHGDASGGAWLHQLCQGGGIAVQAPQPRVRSPALVERLEKLQRQAEEQRYQAMVADITRKETEAAARRDGGLVTYRQQLGFGLHVITLMGAFYVFGHLLGRFVSPSTTMHAACGLVGMMCGMLMETLLFVIKNSPVSASARGKGEALERLAATKPGIEASAGSDGGAGSGGVSSTKASERLGQPAAKAAGNRAQRRRRQPDA